MLADVVRDWGPPPLPVRFRCQKNLRDAHASACKVEKEERNGQWGSFLIELESGMSKTLLEFVVIHELAHIYSWDSGAEYRNDHDEIWGVNYARVYCSVMGTH